MKKRKLAVKSILLILSVLLCLLALTLTVYAAYIGKGSKKGVLVSSYRYFESNVLQSSSAPASTSLSDSQLSAGSYPVSCALSNRNSTTQTVQIRNHNETGEVNKNDISYTIMFWIAADDPNAAKTDYSCSVTFGNTTQTLTPGTPITFTGDFPGSARSSDNYFVTWTSGVSCSGDPDDACRVYALAHPTAPANMSSFYLGGVIRLSDTAEIDQSFHVNCSFDSPGVTDNLRNEAAFIYRITTTGVPPTENTKLTVRFNSQKLDLTDYLSTPYDSLTEEVDGETPTGYTILTVPLGGDSNIVLRFTRGIEWTTADETVTNLNSCITPIGNGASYLTSPGA